MSTTSSRQAVITPTLHWIFPLASANTNSLTIPRSRWCSSCSALRASPVCPSATKIAPDALFDPDWKEEEKPWVLGRQPFGRIAIANSDAGASAYSNVAIDQAHRAVAEILRS